jgi:hypothetical protein
MRAMMVVAMGVVLAGCAAQVVSTSPQSVTVKAPISKVQEAQDLADGECRKVGRQARLTGRPTATTPLWMFDCVS